MVLEDLDKQYQIYGTTDFYLKEEAMRLAIKELLAMSKRCNLRLNQIHLGEKRYLHHVIWQKYHLTCVTERPFSLL